MFVVYKLLLTLLFYFFTGSTIFSQNLELNDNIEEFILKNPEIIIKSLQNYEKNKEQEKENNIKKFLK